MAQAKKPQTQKVRVSAKKSAAKKKAVMTGKDITKKTAPPRKKKVVAKRITPAKQVAVRRVVQEPVAASTAPQADIAHERMVRKNGNALFALFAALVGLTPAVIAIVLTASLSYAYVLLSVQGPAPARAATHQQAAIPAPRLYSNAGHGFSMVIPAAWSQDAMVSESQNQVKFCVEKNTYCFTVDVYTDAEQVDLASQAQSANASSVVAGWAVTAEGVISVNGMKAYRIRRQKDGVVEDVITVAAGGKMLRFHFAVEREYNGTMEKYPVAVVYDMLSTLIKVPHESST